MRGAGAYISRADKKVSKLIKKGHSKEAQTLDTVRLGDRGKFNEFNKLCRAAPRDAEGTKKKTQVLAQVLARVFAVENRIHIFRDDVFSCVAA